MSQGGGERPAGQRYEIRRDVEAALQARLELGPEYEDHIAAGLAERVEELAAYRTAEVRGEAERRQEDREDEKAARTQSFVLAIVSVGAGIPISGIAAGVTDLPGLIVAWAGIVGVNLAHGWSRRRGR
ncbi:MAG: hypothetical protein ACR2LI_02600 [Propionibacteriaceae bacterium]